ncbi:hypothetical protein [Loktanella fryxellensis]|uniref:hypothetical protein n=1 Tax=Loktanella fryxellensis TaxID=245187 RepID=UPI001FE1191D|nr:hypothetical protein [Loktanella fryxellensis]
MAHFASKKLESLLAVLASGDVKEDAEPDPPDHTFIIALAARRLPAPFVADHDAEVDLDGTDDGAGRIECSAHPVAVGGMDLRRKILERDVAVHRNATKGVRPVVHRRRIGIHVPWPQGHAGGFDRTDQRLRLPQQAFRSCAVATMYLTGSRREGQTGPSRFDVQDLFTARRGSGGGLCEHAN